MANIMNITGKMFKIDYIILPFYSSPVTLQYSAVSVVSSAHRPASSVMSITPTVLKIMSPYCTLIFVMCVGHV